ncbi:MAG: hypothetical protein EPO00_12865 [Chloroflexota bacterium]|nr:MAG: hypothetical protein EPO00_12865 [Chloroflexota bacterium]
MARSHGLIALGRLDEALQSVSRFTFGALRSAVAFESRRHLISASVDVLMGNAGGLRSAAKCEIRAQAQGATLWASVARVYAASSGSSTFGSAIQRQIEDDLAVVSVCADIVACHLDWLGGPTLQAVESEIRRRPERWRSPLRRVVAELTGPAQAAAAKLLDEVGTHEDVVLLRKAAKAARGGQFPPAAGRGLSRRLAPRVFVEDLGRIEVVIGERLIEGSAIRRKVLALLAFLLTRTGFAATRDEVLEAMWPDLEPGTAQNSLNQTVYFLRRVFEPQFSEDITPGYVGQDGETLWLDKDLVNSRSRRCRDLVAQATAPADPAVVMELARSYRGKFALDFLYEDWAGHYRDSLHAAYLRVVETSLRADTDSGQYERGIQLAQVATEAEPEAEELQLALTRLYRLSGSLAAAAEQYQSYARTQRDLGLEPEPFEQL